MLTDQIKYQALLDKDASFEGLFWVAVKTTGIFCRPTCTARKPKMENVEFFATTKDAILHGYRPCKVCTPLKLLGDTPPYIQTLLEDLQGDPYLRIKDHDLRVRGIEPANLRRWFLKHHGITFHAFQRMMRVNTAYKKIREGEQVAGAAFDSGYDSLSGFQDSFKALVGFSPSESKKKTVIEVTRFETVLGPMFAGATDEGICLLEFSDRRMLETQFKVLSKLMNASIIQGNNPHFTLLKEQINEYFNGVRRAFSVPLVIPGSDFQKKVWNELQRIPYGVTRSYEEQATAIGNPTGVRAVANANGQNRIAIIIPCHRIIGKDGHLTGYGGGLWRKRWLLDFETSQLKKE